MSKPIVGLIEPIKVYGKRKNKTVLGKFDTGSKRTSIDKKLIKEIGVQKAGTITTISVHGKTKRALTKLKLRIGKRMLTTIANVSDRSRMKYKLLIGRDVMSGNFIIDVSKPKPGDFK